MQLTESTPTQTDMETQTPDSNTQMGQDISRLGIVVGGQPVLINMTDVSEVLPVPTLQPVPLTKHWYLGVANVRGNLYSVTDLAQFLQMPPSVKTSSSRIVLLNSVKTTQAAILIDAVLGLRHVSSMQLLADDQAESVQNTWAQQDARCFSSQRYQDQEGKIWWMLDADALVQDARFIQPSLA